MYWRSRSSWRCPRKHHLVKKISTSPRRESVPTASMLHFDPKSSSTDAEGRRPVGIVERGLAEQSQGALERILLAHGSFSSRIPVGTCSKNCFFGSCVQRTPDSSYPPRPLRLRPSVAAGSTLRRAFGYGCPETLGHNVRQRALRTAPWGYRVSALRRRPTRMRTNPSMSWRRNVGERQHQLRHLELAGDPELLEDALQVPADGVFRAACRDRDVAECPAFGQQRRHLAFCRRESEGRRQQAPGRYAFASSGRRRTRARQPAGAGIPSPGLPRGSRAAPGADVCTRGPPSSSRSRPGPRTEAMHGRAGVEVGRRPRAKMREGTRPDPPTPRGGEARPWRGRSQPRSVHAGRAG